MANSVDQDQMLHSVKFGSTLFAQVRILEVNTLVLDFVLFFATDKYVLVFRGLVKVGCRGGGGGGGGG